MLKMNDKGFAGALILVVVFGAFVVNAKSVALDKARSKVHWVGKKVTGQHNGSLNLKSGIVELDGQKLVGGSFDMDMTSITVEDVKDTESNKKLADHLRSDDFFGVAKHPTSTFKITSVKELKGQKDATHEITGDLSVKGISHSLTFPAQVEIKSGLAKAKGKASIDRTKYDIKYRSGKFFPDLGDKMIEDSFEVEFDLQGKI